MSDQVEQSNDLAQVGGRQALIDAAWDAAEAPTEAPPSREEASQEAAPEEEKPEGLTKESLEEKPSVAKSIREFLQEQRGPREPEGLEREVIELRAALDQIRQAGRAPEKPKSEQQQLLEELQRYRDQEAERVRAAQEEAERAAQEERIAALRDGAVANLRAHQEKFPALFALGQEETVVNELFSRLENDEDASEEQIASEVETGLREVWEKLNPIFAGQSKATPARSESPTISNALAGQDEKVDTSDMSREQLIEYAWKKAQLS